MFKNAVRYTIATPKINPYGKFTHLIRKAYDQYWSVLYTVPLQEFAVTIEIQRTKLNPTRETQKAMWVIVVV